MVFPEPVETRLERLFEEGLKALRAENYPEAFRLFSSSAGFPPSDCMIGACYHHGYGVD